jgi:hypothetical protein
VYSKRERNETREKDEVRAGDSEGEMGGMSKENNNRQVRITIQKDSESGGKMRRVRRERGRVKGRGNKYQRESC